MLNCIEEFALLMKKHANLREKINKSSFITHHDEKNLNENIF
jgi:hypothetical protein